ncbi:MAG: YicC/YloC family endoribonuclease [Ignavibacteria bacterium]|nr:YicC family protein [Ignavibacteria bacterium]
MIVSMTGFGKAEGTFKKKKFSIEIRSVNNRFCEISMRYPKFLSSKDFELKEIVRKKISRGKITININSEEGNPDALEFNIDEIQIRDNYKLLTSIKKIIGSKEEINLGHILSFENILGSEQSAEVDKDEFKFICSLLNEAVDDLGKMKVKEGNSLNKDILERIKFIEKESERISKLSAGRAALERKRILTKVESLLKDKKVIDEKRLELEVILLSEKIDITEEIIRLKSHTKYFIEYAKSDELAGRRLNFLIQEINREINTIASKSLDADVSQKASVLKEELEKIREQLQNVE